MRYLYFILVFALFIAFMQVFWPVIVVLIVGGLILGLMNYYKVKKVVKEYQQDATQQTYQQQPYKKKPAEDVIDVEYTERVDYESDEWS